MRLYNTLTRREEDFAPAHDNIVRMYTCGLTVYARGHIGNFRTFVALDVLRRALRQSASICARSASTSGKARSSRRRWTKDRRRDESYKSRDMSKTCVSMIGRSTSPNVGLMPIFVIEGYTMLSIVTVVAYTPLGGTSSLHVARFAVGKPSSRPRPAPRVTVPSMK